ncbi:MAG TPA: RNA methyltransferase [Nitrospinota bacterium]|jgi:hypothetical protein|nr:RNA methyltransferase [Nitrospinota bacterium]
MCKNYANISLILTHYPVYNKNQEVVVSSITTLDIHDLSRIAKTYGLGTFYIVTPLKAQINLIEKVCSHWETGFGASYNPTRNEAFGNICVADNLDCAFRLIMDREGKPPKVIATGAREFQNSIKFHEMKKKINLNDPFAILLGTGWGLEESVVMKADYILEPIKGIGNYNHLPVRGAAAIIVDRLLTRE